MRRHRPAVAGLIVLLASSGLVGTAAAESSEPRLTGRSAYGQVTLITGDRVTLRGDRTAEVRPGKGREGVKFLQRKEVGGDVTVMPVDALRAVRTGELDARLFNVSKLIEHGFDDRSRPDIPLIVSAGAATLRSGVTQVRALPSVGGVAVRVAKSSAYWSRAAVTLRAAGIQRIRLDGPVRASLDKSVAQIGAPSAWQGGLTGKGTEVAVLDTGIDTGHADLDDAVISAKDFTESESGTADKFGHGTHVASIVTGDNAQYRGVAPDAKLLNGKVLDDEGGGSESGVIAGMEWAAAAGVEVINMSLGDPWPSDGTDAMSQALNKLTAETDALFVVSSGNSGPEGLPGSPAAADAALTVGAVDHKDELARFSTPGPRWLDDAIKPDITAPGVDIVAAKAKDSLLAQRYPNVGEHHLRLSGTSMAAPHVAGAAAILAQQHSDWTAGELKAALMGSAKPHGALSVFQQGAGRVDVAAAVRSTVRAVPGSFSLGIVQWPHHDDKPIPREVTYHNSGSTAVTIPLRAEVRDPSGRPAPAGMFTVSPSTLVIPAGGKASAVVTTNTAVSGLDGIYSGVVVGGDVRTPIAVTREVESYDIKLKFVGFDGQPTSDYWFRFVDIVNPKAVVPDEGSGPVTTARVAKGRHYFESWVNGEPGLAIVVEPEYVVSGAAELVIDARDGKPAGFITDKPNAKPGAAFLSFERDTVWGGESSTGVTLISNNFDGLYPRPSQTKPVPDDFRYVTWARMAEPDGSDGFTTSPYLYHLSDTVPGRVPSALIHRVRNTSLTRVRSHHAATKPGTYGIRDSLIIKPLPYTLEEFYSPGASWHPNFSESDVPDLFESFSFIGTATPRVHRLGRTVTEHWNQAAFGPAFPHYPYRTWTYAARLGDQVAFRLPLHADQVPGRDGNADSTGHTVLSRDGKELGRDEEYPGYLNADVPAGPGTYRLHVEANRDNPLSSRVVTDWTFKSNTIPGEEPAALPLLAVRFAPKVDDLNRTPANRPTVIPVTVDHNTRAKARITGLQFSHDEGTTWYPARLITIAGKTFTVINHPAGAKSVSLKATASDAADNSVDQTIINAFLLK